MSEWRSEGWGNPWVGRYAVSLESKDIHYNLQYIFEAGADAMLEALKKQGAWMTPEQMKLLAPDRKYPYGYIVFIPEEKEIPVSETSVAETFTVGRDYKLMKQLIREHASELFKEHLGHTLEFQEGSPHLLWIRCLDCGKLWDHCDFCLYNKFGGGPLDFGCKQQCSKTARRERFIPVLHSRS
jgi:hypothetical protein